MLGSAHPKSTSAWESARSVGISLVRGRKTRRRTAAAFRGATKRDLRGGIYPGPWRTSGFRMGGGVEVRLRLPRHELHRLPGYETPSSLPHSVAGHRGISATISPMWSPTFPQRFVYCVGGCPASYEQTKPPFPVHRLCGWGLE